MCSLLAPFVRELYSLCVGVKQGWIQSVSLGGDLSDIPQSSLITGSLLFREMKYTSQHCYDKTMDG